MEESGRCCAVLALVSITANGSGCKATKPCQQQQQQQKQHTERVNEMKQRAHTQIHNLYENDEAFSARKALTIIIKLVTYLYGHSLQLFACVRFFGGKGGGEEWVYSKNWTKPNPTTGKRCCRRRRGRRWSEWRQMKNCTEYKTTSSIEAAMESMVLAASALAMTS